MHARIHDDAQAQDIRSMGGLRKHMPITYWTFVASTLAIAGCPLTSGFFSKDEILYRAFVDHRSTRSRRCSPRRTCRCSSRRPGSGRALFVVGVLAATMTAFYMFRLLFVTFWGDFRGWTDRAPEGPLAATRTATARRTPRAT